MVKTFDNFVSSFTGGGGSSGGSGSGKGGDGGSGGLSAAERQRREEQRRQRELDRRASAFDDDIARKLSDQRPDIEADSDGGGNQAAPSLRDLATMTGLDLDRWIHGEPMSAELQVAAMGNPVAQALLQMMRHEQPHLDRVMQAAQSIEQGIVSLFGLAEEGTIEVMEAIDLYKYKMEVQTLAKYQDVPSEEFSELQLEVIDLLNPNDPVVQEWRFDPSSVSMYEYMMEQAFGYEIAFAPGQTDEAKRQQLDRLAESNLEIIRYLDEVRHFGRENSLPNFKQTGRGMFRQVFGENGNVVIHLGANDTQTGELDDAGNPKVIGAFEGLAPQGQDNIFLGSGVTAATITHEFGHQLDRYRDTQNSSFILSSGSNTNIMNLGTFLRDVAVNTLAADDGFTLSGDLADRILRARANAASDSPEIFADIFMTAVLNNRGFTIDPEGERLVGFTDTTNARDVECAFRQYLLQTLSGISVTRDSYIICEDE